jgi:2-oxoglutarate ferredoxin oxidoreductase subunit beta
MENKSFKDYQSKVAVTWCPGCGDYGILNAIQKSMAELGLKNEDVAVVSGIGCSSRFPYFMDTYGFHSIHGRGLTVASGVKMGNPNLSVWQITGDGDAMAIGGNHFIHSIRRNFDINVVLFNNEIYGLTKGQFSPTTKLGKKTSSSPYGTLEHPFNPGSLVLGAGGSFFARSLDTNVKLSTEILQAAHEHKGLTVTEVIQNCVIFSSEHHDIINENKTETQIVLRHGERMIYGKKKDKGLILDENLELKAVVIGENGITEEDILIHDAKRKSPFLHMKLIEMKVPELPTAFGVIRSVEAPVYEDLMMKQIEEVKKTKNYKSCVDFFHSGDTWEVK